MRRPQRSEPRRLCIRRVEIQWEADGQMRSQPALMEDISNSGMGLRVRCPFPLGATVQIKIQNELRRATVRHCARADTEYFMGVQFQKVEAGTAAEPVAESPALSN